jgi:uncharacterized phage-associated protein
MFSGNSYTKDQISKLGNAIIFLCEKMGPLSKTKLLKLIYLIEETSVKKYGLPFFGLRFDVWKLGPVSRELFVEITSEAFLLDDYIEKQNDEGGIFVTAKKGFSDDEFNDLEIQLLEETAARFKATTAAQLIDLTHRKHSPWYLTAEKYGLLDRFDKGLANSSDVEIELEQSIENDSQKLALYRSHKEFIEYSRRLKQ